MTRVYINSLKPPVLSIDWVRFRLVVKQHWKQPTLFKVECGLKVTSHWRFWYEGGPLLVAPFLKACQLMQVDPLDFLMEE